MAEHPEFLTAALTARAGAEPAELRDHLASCADCRRRLEQLRDVERELAEADGLAAEVLEQAAAERDAPGLGAAAELLASQVASQVVTQGALARRRPRPLGWVAALAVAAALVAWVLWPQEPPAGDANDSAPFYLGPEDAPLLRRPLGEVDSYGDFEWDGKLAPGQRFELELIDQSGPVPRALGLPFQPPASPWTPPADLELNTVPRLRWTLTLLGPTGEPLGSASAEASLRRP